MPKSSDSLRQDFSEWLKAIHIHLSRVFWLKANDGNWNVNISFLIAQQANIIYLYSHSTFINRKYFIYAGR